MAGTGQHVAEELADAAGEWPQGRRDTLGKLRALHSLQHELTRKVVVGPVLERELDDRQAEDGPRAAADDIGRVVQGALDGDGDLLLDLLRGEARDRA